MKKNTFYIVTLISSFLISSASFALDGEDPELYALMGNLGVYSPKRPATNPRPDCACRKSPQRSNSAPFALFAPISNKEDHDDAVQDGSAIVPLQHPSPEPMVIGLPVLPPSLEDDLMQNSPVENASPGLENTPPKKRTHLNASVLDPDALSSASSKQSPLRPKNLFADDEDASPKVNRVLKRNVAAADADDDFVEGPLPHQKNASSKRGRR